MVDGLGAASGATAGLAAMVMLVALLLAGLRRAHRPRRLPKTSSLLWRPSAENGFLPSTVPPAHDALHRAEALTAALPELVASGTVRSACDALPTLDLAALLASCSTPLKAELLAVKNTRLEARNQ